MSNEGDGLLPNIFGGVRGGEGEDYNRKASMAELLADFKHAKQERALQVQRNRLLIKCNCHDCNRH